jgi:hypothetical protein
MTQRVPLLACVYTCEAHRPWLAKFHASVLGDYLRSVGAEILEVYADESLAAPVREGRKLTLPTPERYDSLSMKTHAMLRYCVEHIPFERMLKIDVTTVLSELDDPRYEGRRPMDPDAMVRFLRESDPRLEYDGFIAHVGAGREGAEAWARKKGGAIDYTRLFGDGPMPKYFSGKCYLLGRRFAEWVAQYGAAVAQENANHFLGSEDVMVGRLYAMYQAAAGGSQAPPSDTTVVLTSCGRHDLLERTLQSFFQFNTYAGVKRILVVEDGEQDPSGVCERFGAELLRFGKRLGQVACIDLAYATVDTEYIFHLEDDWEFYRPGFIEKSKAFLELDRSTLLAWLRAWDDTNRHPLAFQAEDGSMAVMADTFDKWWHGFTWNPGLRRTADYHKLGSFQSRRAEDYPYAAGGQHEAAASQFYHQLGYRAIILDRGGYVRHIGQGRHIRDQ